MRCKKNLLFGFGIGQVLTCVRPLCAAFHAPRARMEMRGPGPNRLGALEARSLMPGFPDPVS